MTRLWWGPWSHYDIPVVQHVGIAEFRGGERLSYGLSPKNLEMLRLGDGTSAEPWSNGTTRGTHTWELDDRLDGCGTVEG